jgi:hypothetical protein
MSSTSANSGICRINSFTGSTPGVTTTAGQFVEPGTANAPSRMDGMTPARTNDDLPAPDAPTSITIPPVSAALPNRDTNAAVLRSRPKNQPESSGWNAANPR